MGNPTVNDSATYAKRELIIATTVNTALAHSLPYNFDRLDGDDLEELWGPAPVLEPVPTDALKTQAQAARRLGVSIRTLRGLIDSGEVRYVNLGRGKQRQKIMFTDSDLDDLIASRTRQKAPQSCPSISPKARRSTTTTSGGEILAFTARQNGQISGKRKR
jgi:excisionase family DNA binding protein